VEVVRELLYTTTEDHRRVVLHYDTFVSSIKVVLLGSATEISSRIGEETCRGYACAMDIEELSMLRGCKDTAWIIVRSRKVRRSIHEEWRRSTGRERRELE
jgi:hypothetical protein